MAVEFEITDRKVDDETHVIAVTGEIDLFTAPEFKQRMSELIDAGRSRLVVDLSETTFIDSSSLGVLIGAHRRLKLRGRAADLARWARPPPARQEDPLLPPPKRGCWVLGVGYWVLGVRTPEP